MLAHPRSSQGLLYQVDPKAQENMAVPSPGLSHGDRRRPFTIERAEISRNENILYPKGQRRILKIHALKEDHNPKPVCIYFSAGVAPCWRLK